MKPIAVAVLACLVLAVQAYPGGAPTEVCQSLQPSHNSSEPQTATNYLVEVVPVGSRSFNVTVRGRTIFNNLKGIVFQARPASNPASYTPVGTFEPLDDTVQTLTCQNAGDTITHKTITSSIKTSLTFRWNAPASGSGEVKIVGSVVRTYEYWYANVASAAISY